MSRGCSVCTAGILREGRRKERERKGGEEGEERKGLEKEDSNSAFHLLDCQECVMFTWQFLVARRVNSRICFNYEGLDQLREVINITPRHVLLL